jgi:translation initiation factor IF-3
LWTFFLFLRRPYIRPHNPRGPASKGGPRVNKDIRAKEIRVIDEEGEMLGVMSITDALSRAQKVGLDLVEISPNVDPPVCKILDFGKYKYQIQKRKSEAKKKQKIVLVKEIRLRPVTDENDYLVKRRAAEKFIGEGNKVKIAVRFHGRELAHKEIGMRVLNRLISELEEITKVESYPSMMGRQMIMVLAPK